MTGDFGKRQQSTFHIYLFQLAKVIEVYILQMCNQRDTGIDHSNVNSAPSLNDFFKTLCNRGFIGDIEWDAYNVVSCFFGFPQGGVPLQVSEETVEFLARKVGGGQMAAVFQQTLTNAVPDSTGGTGYQRNFILKGQIRIIFLLVNVEYPQLTKTYYFRFTVVPG